MQTEQQNSIGAIKAAGSIGQVSRVVPTTHTDASSTIPTVAGATTAWTTMVAKLGVLVISDDELIQCA